MSKYTFKLYVVDLSLFRQVFSCSSQYTTSRVILSYMSHMSPWNFLPSKFLEGHTMNIVQNSRARLIYWYMALSIYQLIYKVLQPYILKV